MKPSELTLERTTRTTRTTDDDLRVVVRRTRRLRTNLRGGFGVSHADDNALDGGGRGFAGDQCVTGSLLFR